MRYLLYTAFALAACGRADTARDPQVGDTAASTAPAPDSAMSAVPDRLLGTWTAQGYDAGSKRAQQFTITWTRARMAGWSEPSHSGRGRRTTSRSSPPATPRSCMSPSRTTARRSRLRW